MFVSLLRNNNIFRWSILGGSSGLTDIRSCGDSFASSCLSLLGRWFGDWLGTKQIKISKSCKQGQKSLIFDILLKIVQISFFWTRQQFLVAKLSQRRADTLYVMPRTQVYKCTRCKLIKLTMFSFDYLNLMIIKSLAGEWLGRSLTITGGRY